MFFGSNMVHVPVYCTACFPIDGQLVMTQSPDEGDDWVMSSGGPFDSPARWAGSKRLSGLGGSVKERADEAEDEEEAFRFNDGFVGMSVVIIAMSSEEGAGRGAKGGVLVSALFHEISFKSKSCGEGCGGHGTRRGASGITKGGKEASSMSALPLASEEDIRAATSAATSGTGRPEVIESCVVSCRRSFLARHPNPPVHSTPKGTNDQPAWRHRDSDFVTLATSTKSAKTSGLHSCGFAWDGRRGWQTETSTATGWTPFEVRRMSAGRWDAPGGAASSSGAHPASRERWKRQSRTRLCRR